MTRDTTQRSIESVTRSITRELPGRSLMHKRVSYDVTRTDVATTGLPGVEIMLKKCWEIRHRWSRHTRNHRIASEPVVAMELARLRAPPLMSTLADAHGRRPRSSLLGPRQATR